MTRYTCNRCGTVDFTTNPPHLCKDLRKRLERQQKAIALVMGVLHDACLEGTDMIVVDEFVAIDIVRALSGRDLGVE